MPLSLAPSRSCRVKKHPDSLPPQHKGKRLSALLLLALAFSAGRPYAGRAAAPQARPAAPVLIADGTFQPADWTAMDEATGGATYTVSQQLTGGYGSPPFRFMSHRLPPVSGSGLATIQVTHIYLGASYDPAVQGAIRDLDYREAGILLSFPFPEAFSTTQPVVRQGGRLFRAAPFIRFIAQNSSHNWETKSLSGLGASSFTAVDGSGDHPDFSAGGGPLQFGFTRTNSRSSTQPPVDPGEDLVVDQGVDNWQVTVNRLSDPPQNQPPVAVEDVFILDGYRRSLPLLEFFGVVRNDHDPDRDFLEVVSVTQPAYGSAGILSAHTITYQLDVAQVSDNFSYAVSDGDLSASAPVKVFIDCACTVLCLNQLEPPAAASPAAENIDLALIYRLRDQVMRPTPRGNRYTGMYYTRNPEILVNILAHESLRAEAVATVETWQDNLRSLVDGDGSAVITQAQVDAIESFLSHLSAVSSPGLQQLIAGELAHLGPLDDYVGLTVGEAKRRAIGDPALYLPALEN